MDLESLLENGLDIFQRFYESWDTSSLMDITHCSIHTLN